MNTKNLSLDEVKRLAHKKFPLLMEKESVSPTEVLDECLKILSSMNIKTIGKVEGKTWVESAYRCIVANS